MTAQPFILDIDPGNHGGSVLLDEDCDPLWAWRWVQLKRTGADGKLSLIVYRLDSEPLGGGVSSTEHRTLAGVGAELARQVGARLGSARVHLVAEGLFVHSMARSEAAITLGKEVGWLTAGLLESVLSFREPKACEWRPLVLGCDAYASSDLAERLALRRWATRWRGALATDPHVAEADAMGRSRWIELNPRQGVLLAAQPVSRRRRTSR